MLQSRLCLVKQKCYLSNFHALPLIDEIASIFSFAQGEVIAGVFWVLGALRGHVLSTTTNDHLETHARAQTHTFKRNLTVLKQNTVSKSLCYEKNLSYGEPYIYVSVIEELGGNVGAAVKLGGIRHVSVTVPRPAGAVGVAGCWGGMLHPCCCHNADSLSYKIGLFHAQCAVGVYVHLYALCCLFV